MHAFQRKLEGESCTISFSGIGNRLWLILFGEVWISQETQINWWINYSSLRENPLTKAKVLSQSGVIRVEIVIMPVTFWIIIESPGFGMGETPGAFLVLPLLCCMNRKLVKSSETRFKIRLIKSILFCCSW